MGAYNVINRAAMAGGQPENVGDVLANFDALATLLNGNLDDFNIKAAANIAISKLLGYPADATKFLKGDGSWGVNPSGQLSMSVGQSIPHAVSTQVVLGAGLTGSPWGGVALHAAPDGLIAPTTGIYLVHAIATWTPNAAGIREINLRRWNAAGAVLGNNQEDWLPNAANDSRLITAVIVMNATDYIAPQAYQSSGAALVLTGLYLSLTKIA